MNDIVSYTDRIFKDIQSDFSDLWECRTTGDALELITPYSTISGEAISVFLTQRGDRYIITDGARIDELGEEQGIDIVSRKGMHLQEMSERFGIKSAGAKDSRHLFRFKSTTSIDKLSACIYDLVHFQESISNAVFMASYFDGEEDAEVKKFCAKVNAVVKQKVERVPVKERRYDYFRNAGVRGLQFNTALIDKKTSQLWLSMCISGTSLTNFRQSVYRAEFGFKHIADTDLVLHPKMHFATVADRLSFGQTERAMPLFNAMEAWKKDYHVSAYSLDEFEQCRIDDLWRDDKAA